MLSLLQQMIVYPRLAHRRSGFLLLEVLLGIALFSLYVMAIGYTLLYGQENTIMSGDRIRATQITEKAIEATRTIRDGSYSSVTPGRHGVWVHPTSKMWAFSGSQVTTSGGYVTTVTVTPWSGDWNGLSAQTKWKHGYNRSGSVLITSEMTDWRTTRTVGDWGNVTVEGTYTDGGTPLFNNVTTYSGSYAFLTAPSSPGLYVIDTHTLASPARVNTSFSMGTGGYDSVTRGQILYVLTGDSTQELRSYLIFNPKTFYSTGHLLSTYNLPGSARGRSLAIVGDTLYVGATASAVGGEDEFYAFRVTNAGTMTLLDSINDDSSTVSSIAVVGTGAYLASSMDTSELRVVDVETGSNIVLLDDFNLSDRTLDGLSVAVSGTSAILGTAKSTGLEEALLIDLKTFGVPAAPLSPWYHEGSGSIVGIDMEPARCYAFLSALSGRKAFQVFNMRNKATLAELYSYNSTTGLGRGLAYDVVRDRVFLITDRSLIVMQPGVTTGTCP